jgi:Bacterial alpha-L-rhamnosidase 6 hairpin glycosidase domain/Bacterial alpha-L-rhamnosidase C-terminal domain
MNRQCAVAALASSCALCLTSSATGAPVHGVLGLPATSAAQSYILAPSSRTVAPVGVTQATPADDDYVTPGSSVSETDAHHLSVGTSTTSQLDGVTVRQAGPGQAGGHFAYTLHVTPGHPVSIRVEEAGSATADYWVLVDGVRVYHRRPNPQQSGSWDNLAGVVHYQFNVPARVLAQATNRRRLRIAFRNTATPGDGARIAGVWALSPNGRPGGAYGGTVQNAAQATGGAGMTLSSHIFGRPFAVFDFGHDVGGQVQMTLANAGQPTKLGLAFSESDMYMTSASDFSEDPAGVATETHYVTVPHGSTTFTDPVIRGGFRYLMVFLDEPGAVRVSDLRLHFTPSPTAGNLRSYPGSFLSADDQLNRLWYAGAYTVQLDTIDPTTGRIYPAQSGPVENNATIASGPTAITDGAKRDRMDWVGDQSVEDPVSFLTTGDTLSAEDSFAFMGQGAAANGEVPGIFLPGSGYNLGWGEYAAWWIYNYWQYYLYTGDHAFLDKWFGAVRNDVSWFESLVGANGLLNIPGSASGHWGYGNAGEETYDNALYVWVLQAAARAAGAEGDSALAAQYAADGQRTAAAINANLWDAQAGAYIVDPGDSAHPQDGNVMAILAGVATGAREASVLSFLHTQWTPYGADTIDQPGNIVGQYVSPFVSYYELLAYATQNSSAATDDALQLLQRTWATMLAPGWSGTMWENVSLSGAPQLGSYTSLAHGWSAGVVPFLTNQVLGVTPTGGGFSTFTVLPHAPTSLPWAEGTVPTPAGPITAGWRHTAGSFSLEVQAPSGTTYSAGVPDGATTVTANGQTVWSNGQATAPGVSDDNGYIVVSGATGDTVLKGSY